MKKNRLVCLLCERVAQGFLDVSIAHLCKVIGVPLLYFVREWANQEAEILLDVHIGPKSSALQKFIAASQAIASKVSTQDAFVHFSQRGT